MTAQADRSLDVLDKYNLRRHIVFGTLLIVMDAAVGFEGVATRGILRTDVRSYIDQSISLHASHGTFPTNVYAHVYAHVDERIPCLRNMYRCLCTSVRRQRNPVSSCLETYSSLQDIRNYNILVVITYYTGFLNQ